MKKLFKFVLIAVMLCTGYAYAQPGCPELPASLTSVTPSSLDNNIYTIDYARAISLTADVDPTGINPNLVIYQWDFGGGAILYGKTINYTSVQEGLITLTLTTTYQGCATVTTFPFNVQKGVPFSLYRQFNGKYDYLAIGNTLNLQENAGILVSDECGVLTESSATLSLQPGQTIAAAYLYWAGSGNGDFNVKLNNIDVTAERTFYSTIAAGANNPKPSFGAFADVTNIVTNSGTYTLSDLDITQTLANDTDYCYYAMNFAGWSVIIVYNDPALPYNQVGIYDGFMGVDAQNPLLNIHLDNLNVISNQGAKIGFLAWEGDNGIAVNESVSVNGSILSNPPLNPANNAFNGTNSFTGASDLWNMDIDYYTIQNYINVGDTDLDVSLTSGQDGIIVHNIVTVVNSELPDASIEMIFLSGTEECLNRNLQVVYMAKNYNSTDVLPANTPIAVYADDVLIATTATTADIAMEGSETGVLSITLPPQIPNEFTLKVVIDDDGTGVGIQRETDETNNEYTENVTLRSGIEPQEVTAELYACSNGTEGTFNLTEATTAVTEDYETDFYTSLENAESETDVITDATNFVSGNATVYVRVYDTFSPSCYEIAPVTLTLFDCQPHTPDNVEICAPTGQDLAVFNLDTFKPEILNGRNAVDYSITFHNSAQGATENNDLVASPQNVTVISGTPATVYVRMESATNTDLFGTTSFTISVVSPPVIVQASSLVVCDDTSNNDGIALFNLTAAVQEILNGQTNLTATVHLTQSAAENGLNPQNQASFTNTVPNAQTVYVRVVETGSTTNCFSLATINLTVNTLPQSVTVAPIVECESPDTANGISEFDLTQRNDEIINGNTNVTVTYFTNQDNAENNTSPVTNPTTYSNVTAYNDVVYFRLTNTATGCYTISSYGLQVTPLPDANTTNPVFFACEEVPGEGLFDFADITPTVTNGQSGYTVKYYTTEAQAIDGTGSGINQDVPYQSADTTLYALVTNAVTGCKIVVSLGLDVQPAPIAPTPTALEECDFNNDEVAAFNLQAALDEIQAAMGNGVTLSIHETLADAEYQQGTNPITGSELNSYTNVLAQTTGGVQTLYIRVSSATTECFDVVELQLIVHPTPVATDPLEAYHVCDNGQDDTDGIALFDLTSYNATVLNTMDPAQFTVRYYPSYNDAVAGSNVIGTPATFTSPSTTVYLKVSNNTTGCYDIVALELVVDPLPEANQPQPYTLCDVNNPGDEREEFDLTSRIEEIIGVGVDGVTVTFHHSLADAQSGDNAIDTPEAYTNATDGVEAIYVRVADNDTDCYRVVLLDIRVAPLPVLTAPTTEELTVCDTNGMGFGNFDLDALVQNMVNNGAGLTVAFYQTYNDALNGFNPIGNTANYQNVVAYNQPLYVVATDAATGCTSVVYTINLVVAPAPRAFTVPDLVACDDQDNNGQDNQMVFDLTVQNTVIETQLNVAAGTYTIHYFATEAAAQAGTPRITAPQTYNGTGGQVIWVRVEVPATECYAISSFELEIHEPQELAPPTVFTQCNEGLPNDFTTTFDLTQMNDYILTPFGIGESNVVEYFETQADMDNNNPISPDTAYENTSNPQVLLVRVTTPQGCESYSYLTLRVTPLPTPNQSPTPLELCDTNDANLGDGFEEFDLTLAQGNILGNDSQSQVSFYTTEAAAWAGDITAPEYIGTPTSYTNAVAWNDTVWVRVTLTGSEAGDPGCAQVVALPLVVNPLPPVYDAAGVVPLYAICNENTTGFETFYLMDHVTGILTAAGEVPTDYTIRFYASMAAYTAGTALPHVYTNTTAGHQQIYVYVRNNTTRCEILTTLDLYAELAAVANPVTAPYNPYTECDYDGVNDGFYSFDFTPITPIVLGSQSATDYSVEYYTTEAAAAAGDTTAAEHIADPSAYTNTSNPQTIWVTVTNLNTFSPCRDVTSFEIAVELLAEPVISTDGDNHTICIDLDGTVERSLTLQSGVPSGSYTFAWYRDGVDVTANPAENFYVATVEGSYTVIATSTSANGCVSEPSASFDVIKSGQAAIIGNVGYVVSNAFSSSQTITVLVEGNGEYQYALDEDGPWQNSNVFTNVPLGYFDIHVRDVKTDNPCDDLIIGGVSIIDYPRYFTPNADGFNDYWNIQGLDQIDPTARIYIFDRYGKLLKQLSPASRTIDGDGWDGTYNGQELPSDDYWFKVEFTENGTAREFRAHFAMKR